MPKVKSPNKHYNGVSVGVAFVNGVAETNDPVALEYFAEHGYEFDPEEAPKADKPLDKYTKPELEAVAAEEGIDLSEAANNAERVAAIVAARQASQPDAPAE